MRISHTLAALLLLAACGQKAPEPAPEPKKSPASEVAVAPAIIAPHEIADSSAAPSYEVAIASVAADHNAAKERCATQPESVRSQCEQEANAAFSGAASDLDDLRGNKQ